MREPLRDKTRLEHEVMAIWEKAQRGEKIEKIGR